MVDRRPFRAVLNFTQKCSMNCEWCYVPFCTAPARAPVVQAIVSRVAELGFTSITIGGGDPFQYPFIPAILRHAKSCGLFVHVDTNGKGLRQSPSNLKLIEDTVDLLGLPLDGSESTVHDQMRNSPKHFGLICGRIAWLGSLRSRLKINTIVSAANSHDIANLGRLLTSLAPARWSVYQYWPLGPAARAATKHSISDALFLRSTAALSEITGDNGPVLEIIPGECRRNTTPIIHHDGEVFAHTAFPNDEFLSLGSIFDSDSLKLMCSACSAGRPIANTRYIVHQQTSTGK